ncbi:MAG: trans-2-enoyl-CoA reductase [Spirochaetes bacterium GWF1_31_7]|nr:MAG: trans-2-enoyl-CoA reductase [Spirochaetes bacterium GWE1_32_154]OHD49527.1 MAG: trans-2-enoyl-CoA reductase [Spirochaetes bacterium GWE2_31_10]OHD49720.1 MAG: trans-2-enoyl-CoA reductase [Spirochaetes bacterium GWF1_31_7]OHD77306.1 MAG: trans-2-enoyl-CoA reductase [Spirochaetes bacterium RIFOXYB1_FULL_32_8]HBD95682.1 bifunctional NADH-specific enoyl-ACP reductase/trans-2-enoyl-CoA reductase [Spirochaetia bacterium]
MIIKPVVRNYMCFSAHPDGCRKNIIEQIDYVQSKKKIENGPKNVLIIGASTGYGMASRIVSAFGCNANTIGIFFERNAEEGRTASAGMYNTAHFEELSTKNGKKSWSINGDAFSNDIKNKTIALIKEKIGKIDAVIYSIASPKRTNPDTGEVFASTLKPIGKEYTTKTLNFSTGKIGDVTLPAATEEDIEKTIYVMGGEDWEMWIDALLKADVLDANATTVAYSYIGPVLTYPIYRDGTIGRAKEHLEKTAFSLTEKLAKINGRAFVSVNKALVTQASSAIPAVPLYISLLYKSMKEKNIHEDCIQQVYRLYSEHLYNGNTPKVDNEKRIRIDDWEMREDVQKEISAIWDQITDDNIRTFCDLDGYRKDFFRLFGFDVDGVDYEKDVDPTANITLI